MSPNDTRVLVVSGIAASFNGSLRHRSSGYEGGYALAVRRGSSVERMAGNFRTGKNSGNIPYFEERAPLLFALILDSSAITESASSSQAHAGLERWSLRIQLRIVRSSTAGRPNFGNSPTRRL